MAQNITIYTTPTCAYCKMAKAFFNQHNIVYVEKDVSVDEKAQEEMMEKSHQLAVPVIDIDGKIIVGFDRPQVAAALNIK